MNCHVRGTSNSLELFHLRIEEHSPQIRSYLPGFDVDMTCTFSERRYATPDGILYAFPPCISPLVILALDTFVGLLIHPHFLYDIQKYLVDHVELQ